MTSNNAFFQQKQAAAVLKHGVLRRYPLVFATMTGSRSKAGRVVFVDGYAGPGRYEDGAPGSPLLAVRMAGRVANWSRAVECIFIERDPMHHADLQRCLADEAPLGLAYRVLQGDVSDHVSTVMSSARSAPLLTFLDPFGTALEYDTLRTTFLGRSVNLPTEVLLNFNLEMVSRIGGQLARPPEDHAAQKTLERLDRFLGGSWWRDAFRQARGATEQRSAAEAALRVAEAYQERVFADTGFRSFPVPVRRRPSHLPLFLLVLFFRSDVAPWKFNDAVSLANAEWRDACIELELAEWRAELDSQSRVGQDMLPGLDAHVESTVKSKEEEARLLQTRNEREWVDTIERNLRVLLAQQPSVPLRSRINDVFGTTLGLARDTHVNQAWKRLVTAGVAAPKATGVRYLYQATLRRAH